MISEFGQLQSLDLIGVALAMITKLIYTRFL